MGWSLKKAFRHPGKALAVGTKKATKIVLNQGISVGVGASGGRVGATAKLGKVPIITTTIARPSSKLANKVPVRPIPKVAKSSGCYGIKPKTSCIPTLKTNDTYATLNQKFNVLVGRHVGESTECVALVKALWPNLGSTSGWQRGLKVKGATLTPGTPIATFAQDGKYQNKSGLSHAAIFCRFVPGGIEVFDQCNAKTVTKRVIKYKNGAESKPVNDADKYYVIKK
jgi:hypothetical protein